MAEVWVLIEFTDETGKHNVGDKIDLSNDTDAQKAAFETMKSYGIISERAPRIVSEDPEAASTAGRTRPGRR